MHFLYFSTLQWDEAGGAHNPTQISRALARCGHRITFVEPQPSARRSTDGLPITIIALTELGVSPTQLRRMWFGLDSGDLSGLAAQLAAALTTDAEGPPVALFAAPFEPYVRLVPVLRAAGYRIIYYAMDDFGAAPALGYTQFVPAAHAYLAHNADTLIGVTLHVAATLEHASGKQQAAHVIPNGIDPAASAARDKRTNAPSIKHGELTLGFWGTLMESMFDAALIAHVATAHPEWMIHLLGAADPESHRASVRAQLAEFPNVFFHGAVPHSVLPDYAARFDVLLAPFPDNAFTRGRDPIKVYEYLACGKPVVAAFTPQLADFPNVWVAYAADEFVSAIKQAAAAPPDSVALANFLGKQTWDARAAQLLAILNALPPITAQAENVSILPTLAQPDASVIMRYAWALEQELEQVQAWARDLEMLANRPPTLERVRRRFQKV